jgi:predicted NUDIX family phosphoesterase
MKKWSSIIDVLFIFVARPEISMQREYANLLTRKTGSIMNPKVLASYKKSIFQTKEQFANLFSAVEVIDTSNNTLNDVNFNVTDKILNALHELVTEKIGYVERAELELLDPEVKWDASLFDRIRLHFGGRDEVERNHLLVQPIPILVVTNRERSQVLVVKKRTQTSASRSAERGKLLLYIGGHVRYEDSWRQSSNSATLARCLEREAQEEVDFSISIRHFEESFLIWSRDNPRSEQHLAVCFVREIDFSHANFELDEYEFLTSAGGSKSGSIMDITEIARDPMNLESWSSIIMDRVFGVPIRLL